MSGWRCAQATLGPGAMELVACVLSGQRLAQIGLALGISEARAYPYLVPAEVTRRKIHPARILQQLTDDELRMLCAMRASKQSVPIDAAITLRRLARTGSPADQPCRAAMIAALAPFVAL